MPIPCKLPILKNISYLSGAMFTFSIFIPMFSETPAEAKTNPEILQKYGMSGKIGLKLLTNDLKDKITKNKFDI